MQQRRWGQVYLKKRMYLEESARVLGSGVSQQTYNPQPTATDETRTVAQETVVPIPGAYAAHDDTSYSSTDSNPCWQVSGDVPWNTICYLPTCATASRCDGPLACPRRRKVQSYAT
eukprot:3722484-Pyramimonas_sp.AAC.1